MAYPARRVAIFKTFSVGEDKANTFWTVTPKIDVTNFPLPRQPGAGSLTLPVMSSPLAWTGIGVVKCAGETRAALMDCNPASNETRVVPPDRPVDREVIPGSASVQTTGYPLENTVSSTVQLSPATISDLAKTK
jgi:hypothetical protein